MPTPIPSTPAYYMQKRCIFRLVPDKAGEDKAVTEATMSLPLSRSYAAIISQPCDCISLLWPAISPPCQLYFFTREGQCGL